MLKYYSTIIYVKYSYIKKKEKKLGVFISSIKMMNKPLLFAILIYIITNTKARLYIHEI